MRPSVGGIYVLQGHRFPAMSMDLACSLLSVCLKGRFLPCLQGVQGRGEMSSGVEVSSQSKWSSSPFSVLAL
jgi:hypothetical protein